MAIQTRKIKDIAQALVQTAQGQDAVAEVVRSVHLVGQSVKTHRRFLAEYADATIPLDTRRHALIETFEKSVHPLVLNTLCIMQEGGVLKDFGVFAAAVVNNAQSLAEHYEIHVTSAVPLTPEERSDLSAILKGKFGGTQHLHEDTDESILGGMVITVGDWTFDASVKGKITRLKQALSVAA
ncbi:ATP synthase F1 subunit delta [Candidatus Uhrbacteria bacterium]|nr:ATP synthase F1 subunit delta [Candidatus Uhrbacteria bacterium]